ncbi:unnamed protein product [Dovyalis caffra]|uniref:Dirigent protein n=1 Tax=Dovyalis caffra TaxID=77055 RepID=A0AAV1S0K4_9ROSI|nr:unnamed protein product [Dovyalis caffra]
MAKTLIKLPFLFLFLTTVLFSFALATGKSDSFSRNLSPKKLGLKREKLSHLHFYFHDTLSGENPTAIPVAQAATTNKSSTSFGLVVMMDDPLTLKPEVKSKQVGRAQGFYASASQSEISFLMTLNFSFTEGKYNGSTLSILGRNSIFSGVREMPIVGGSGLFRFARGYAQAKTHTINLKTNDAIVEYNVVQQARVYDFGGLMGTREAGSGIDGMLSAVHGFNTGIPFLQNRLKGPKWLPFLVGLPSLLAVSSASAAFGGRISEVFMVLLGFGQVREEIPHGFGSKVCDMVSEAFIVHTRFLAGYVFPKFAQLTVTSYYAASSASHYGISLLTRHIEEDTVASSELVYFVLVTLLTVLSCCSRKGYERKLLPWMCITCGSGTSVRRFNEFLSRPCLCQLNKVRLWESELKRDRINWMCYL